MKRTFLFTLLLWASLPASAFCDPSWSGKVVGVFEGDTLTVINGSVPERIRLAGIDCPEQDREDGIRAREFAEKMVLGKTVEVVPRGKDNFGRTVGVVRIEENDLAEALLKEGLAIKATEYSSKEKETVLQRMARLKKKALGVLFMGMIQKNEK